MSRIWREFREFAVRGNVIDMAVGIIIGAAFTGIAQSLVADLLMPPLGLLTGEVDFSNQFWVLRAGEQGGTYLTLAQAHKDGAVTVNYGRFGNQVLSFLLVAWATFALVKLINRLRRPADDDSDPADTKACPFCVSTIPMKAVRCPQCTSTLADGGHGDA